MNTEFKKIIDNLKFPLIIWKNKDSEIKCFYSNNLIKEVSYDSTIEEYINNNNIICNDKYKNIIKNNKSDNYIINNINVIIEFITPDLFYEIHIPECNNSHILSTISYKIRLPLTNIIGVLALLNELNFNEEQIKYINIIKKSSYDLIELANDIIDILNFKQDKIKLEKNKINIQKLAEKCYKIIKNDKNSNKLNIKFTLDIDLPKFIFTDNKRLEQLIINILTNAIEATNTGNVHMSIELFEESDFCPFEYNKINKPYYNLLFEIKDTGIGINKEKSIMINKMLDLKKDNNLYDINNCNNFTGFGLLISKYICNSMDGNIWFKSDEDMGSVFYFNIICEGYEDI